MDCEFGALLGLGKVVSAAIWFADGKNNQLLSSFHVAELGQSCSDTDGGGNFE